MIPIYKSYPVYAPGRVPPGYIEKLKHLKPELAFNPEKLKLEKTGSEQARLYSMPPSYGTEVALQDLDDPAWYAATRVAIAKDGTVPWVRYVIRGTGNIEVGNLSCGFCHTRVMDDGAVIKAAQGNFAFDKAIAFRNRKKGTARGDSQYDARPIHGSMGAPDAAKTGRLVYRRDQRHARCGSIWRVLA